MEALLGAFNRAEWELPVEDLVSLARLVLENNYFEFDEKIFRQKLGTAIGTKFAPGFANIFMGHLEEKFLETCELKPWVWWRFLDDIFVIWLHSEEELNYFLLCLNSFHENIKYTWDISYHRIYFLDVSVGLDNGVFCTDVYSKPTDAHQYLNFKSCHPPHVKRGIPYGQALRLKRICHSDKVFESRLQELKGFLVKRGYNSEFVESQFKRVRFLDRSALFKRGSEQTRRESNKSTFIIDYHPALREIYGIFRELQNIVGLSSKFLSVMPEPPMVCFRRSKTLKTILFRLDCISLRLQLEGWLNVGGKSAKFVISSW